MMNTYQSKTGLEASASKEDLSNKKPPIGARITESPYYSAHSTNTKFFKTIDESPILGARGSTPKKERIKSLYETQDFRRGSGRAGVSAIQVRNQMVDRWREK